MRYLLALIALILLATGCPKQDTEHAGDAAADEQFKASIRPSEPIPEDSPLKEYAGLHLGMSGFEISQAYNAPQGKGDGFSRVVEFFGDVHHHRIDFERGEGEPGRVITAYMFRDELYILVDRREGFTKEHRDSWFDECVANYGEGYETILPNSQWSWGSVDSVMLTFTQDNASEDYMNGNVVLEHKPTREAAHNYLADWESRNPEAVEE